MFPIPFVSMPEYGLGALTEQISIKLVVFAHVPTIIISLLFAILLYKQTKKLSALYLLLLTITFSLWAYFDFVTWTTDARGIVFAWSILDLFNILFVIFTYWFLYAFIKEKDVPFWQKLLSSVFLVPTFVYTLLGKNLGPFFIPNQYAIENTTIALYPTFVGLLFLIILIIFTFIEYRKATDSITKRKILLGGLGTGAFLSIFSFSFLITNMMLYLGVGTPEQAYNICVYSLFGMPIFTGLLSYLIAKYQAFDLKVIKAILYIFILMVLLFVTMFL